MMNNPYCTQVGTIPYPQGVCQPGLGVRSSMMPGTGIQGTMVPGTMMPGKGIHGSMAPGTMMPGAGMQGGAAPGTMMPGAGMQGGAAPGTMIPGGAGVPGGQQLFQEESYIENILRMNLGKTATIYMTFENNSEWNAKIFKGVLEAAGRDHIIIS